MDHRLYIDNIDVTSTYGVSLLQGCYEASLGWPNLSGVESVIWPEVSGEDIDLTNASLDAQTLTIPLFVKSEYIDTVISNLTATPMHVFRFSAIGHTIEAKVNSIEKEALFFGSILTIELRECQPLKHYTRGNLASVKAPNSRYSLDNTTFKSYGIEPLEGTHEELSARPEVRSNLIIDNVLIPGEDYDTAAGVVYASKDATLHLKMRGSNPIDVVNNYLAFMYDISQPTTHTLTDGDTTYDIYYKSSQIHDVIVDEEGIWMTFDVNVEQYNWYDNTRSN